MGFCAILSLRICTSMIKHNSRKDKEMGEAFVYLWYDAGWKRTGGPRYYIGKHKGTLDSGYVCSSNYMKPEWEERGCKQKGCRHLFGDKGHHGDFHRRVLAYGTEQEMIDFEIELLTKREKYFRTRYYNRVVRWCELSGSSQKGRGFSVKDIPTDVFKTLQAMWGANALSLGVTFIPTDLLKHASSTGMKAAEQLLLIHLISYWEVNGTDPYPSLLTLRKRTGMTEKTISNHLKNLDKKGWLSRQRRYDNSYKYVLAPLAERTSRLTQKKLEILEGII